MTDSAQGIDVSSYQQVVTPAQLAGLAFAFAKATEGSSITDSRFAANWAVIKAAGLHAGAYHELWPGMAEEQAAYFLAAVVAAGLEPGDMLAVSVSDYPVSDADAKAFLDAVATATGGRNPVICYTDLDSARGLASCTAYPLWIAWPADAAPADVSPWAGWKLWQWNMTGVDQDAYNGTPADMAAWIATYTKPSPPPAESWEDKLMATIPVISKGTSNTQAVKNWQAILVAHSYDLGVSGEFGDGVDGNWGDVTQAQTLKFQKDKGLAQDGRVGPETWAAGLAA